MFDDTFSWSAQRPATFDGVFDLELFVRIRTLVEQSIENTIGSVNWDRALELSDILESRDGIAIRLTLDELYARLQRRKALYQSLELLDYCVRNHGLPFVQQMDTSFLKAMTRLLKLTSLNQQTLVGKVKWAVSRVATPIVASNNRSITALTSSSTRCPFPITEDLYLLRCQKKVLAMLQLWADSFMMYESQVPSIFEVYRKLRAKGYPFPPRDVGQRFLVKHAEASPAFLPSTARQASPEGRRDEGAALRNSVEKSSDYDSTDEHYHHIVHQFTRSLAIVETARDPEKTARALAVCRMLQSRLVELTRHLADVNPDDPRLPQLLDLQEQAQILLMKEAATVQDAPLLRSESELAHCNNAQSHRSQASSPQIPKMPPPPKATRPVRTPETAFDILTGED